MIGAWNGTCDGVETVQSCPPDCSFLLNHLGGTCATPGGKDTCANGYFCVARSGPGGGNVCVADFDTWQPMPDAHPAADFTEFTDYVIDKLSAATVNHPPRAEFGHRDGTGIRPQTRYHPLA